MPEPKASTVEEPENKPAGGSGTGTPPKPEDAPKLTQAEHQAELDRIAAKVRAEEKQKYETAQADAVKKQKEKELAEQGKLKELADTREKERDAVTLERDDYKGKYESLAETVKKSVDAEIKELPESIRRLAPAEDNLDARLGWLPEAKKSAQEFSGEAKPGNSRGPKPTSETPQDQINQIIQRKRASGQYSR